MRGQKTTLLLTNPPERNIILLGEPEHRMHRFLPEKGGVNPLSGEVAQGLSDEFGGKPEDWQHCKAKGWLDVDGEAVKAEVHWFQNGSEKVKFKVKRWLYDED